jgi:hypothetical protein
MAALSSLRHGFQAVTSNRNASDPFACKWLRAPATNTSEGLEGAAIVRPLRFPRNYPGIRCANPINVGADYVPSFGALTSRAQAG